MASFARRLALLGLVLGPCAGCSPSRAPDRVEEPIASSSSSAAASGSASSGRRFMPVRARALPSGRAEPPRVALGTKGAVATQEVQATDVGLAVLQAGGNAVDAAVAIGFTLAVTHPAAGNVGGGGFLIIRMATGEVAAMDCRERAPAEAHRNMYLDVKGEPMRQSLEGPKAAGIPGTVAGLGAAHARFGRWSWRDVVLPAVRLAREGFTPDAVAVEDLAEATKTMRERGFAASARYYERADGKPLEPGDRLVQPELGKTLETIAQGGAGAFYRGSLAETLVREVRAAGGIWQARDLESYEAKWRAPIVFAYRGREIITMPPPSSGGIVLRQLLGASEVLRMEQRSWRSADEIHLFAEAARRAYADRNTLVGDPDQVAVPLATLLDPAYIARRMGDVDLLKATPSTQVRPGIDLAPGVPTAPPRRESVDTTHFSVVDQEGNAVACTTTLNTSYGSMFVVPGTGVLLNNEMDDFTIKPGSPNVYGLVQGEANVIAPGKRPLSSMTPTIVAQGGQLRAVLGTPGGPTISTTVAQLVRALIDYGEPLDAAVPAPRAHHQWLPDEIALEATIPADVRADLERRGHRIVKRERMGHANCIEIDEASGGMRAVADTTRGGGKAAAY